VNKIIFLTIIGVVAVVVLSTVGVLAYRWVSAPTRGAVEQREITNRGQYRIQAYEQFYRWQEQIAAIEVKVLAYPGEELDIRQKTECQGLLAQRADIVAKYNTASRAERTQAQWQDPDLPHTLSHEPIRSCG
jgi:type II secretory pathway pseudopilin PulG